MLGNDYRKLRGVERLSAYLRAPTNPYFKHIVETWFYVRTDQFQELFRNTTSDTAALPWPRELVFRNGDVIGDASVYKIASQLNIRLPLAYPSEAICYIYFYCIDDVSISLHKLTTMSADDLWGFRDRNTLWANSTIDLNSAISYMRRRSVIVSGCVTRSVDQFLGRVKELKSIWESDDYKDIVQGFRDHVNTHTPAPKGMQFETFHGQELEDLVEQIRTKREADLACANNGDLSFLNCYGHPAMTLLRKEFAVSKRHEVAQAKAFTYPLYKLLIDASEAEIVTHILPRAFRLWVRKHVGSIHYDADKVLLKDPAKINNLSWKLSLKVDVKKCMPELISPLDIFTRDVTRDVGYSLVGSHLSDLKNWITTDGNTYE